jgi:hypothetical protein
MFSIFILIFIVVAVGVSFTVVAKKKQDTNGANRFFSVSSMTEKLSLLAKRFPISILLVIGLAVLFFVAINGDFDDISYKFWFFLSVGAFISITVTLFAEDFLNNLKTYGITFFTVLLWGVYCFFLPEKGSDIQIGKWIEIFVIGGTAFLAMLFIPFLKKNKDRAFWNFATQTLFQIALACVFAAILFGGLSLALLAIESLFNVSVAGKVYGNLAVVCFVLFAPLYFLANIPNKTEKHSDEIFYTKVQKVLALYILTPILAVYAVILYAYLFKIIITWELPNGWVSWLVSALALGGLLVIMFLYPVREESENKVIDFLSRWFGLLILPLLVLMSIGIFRRIGDYGLTINRCYVLLLNLWFYGIYIYLFFSQSRHIKWILISPVVIALLTSVSVWSMANVTKNSLTKEVSIILNKQVSVEETKAIVAEMTQEEKDKIRDKLEYLYYNFGKESVQPFFADTVSDGYWSFLSELGLRDTFDEEYERIYYTSHKELWQIEPYTTFARIDYYDYKRDYDYDINYSLKKDTVEVSIGNRTFSLPMRKIALAYLATNESLRDERELVIKGKNYKVLIREFYGSYYPAKDSILINSLDGYLFYK